MEEQIHNYLTDNDERSIEDIAEIFDNNSDIEIAMDIYDNIDCGRYDINYIEKEVAYLRKTRAFTIVE